MSISAQEVMKLRKMTGAGMMDCKKALEEAGGEIESAVDYLRKKGLKTAEKRAGREAKEGRIVTHLQEDGRGGAILELNAETDFVAGTEDFRRFAADCARRVFEHRPADVESLLALPSVADEQVTLRDALSEMTAKLGEKMGVRRFSSMHLPDDAQGRVHSYIHHGDKHGVLIAATCGRPETAQADEFGELIYDLALQIVAYTPRAVDREGLDEGDIERELEIYREQARNEGKPEKILDKIAQGKLNKFYSEATLMEQSFVKEEKVKVQEHVNAIAKNHDDRIVVEGFEAYVIGE